MTLRSLNLKRISTVGLFTHVNKQRLNFSGKVIKKKMFRCHLHLTLLSS